MNLVLRNNRCGKHRRGHRKGPRGRSATFERLEQRHLLAVINAASVAFADVQAAVSTAVAGDTVALPIGTATWTSLLTLDKGIHLQGAGSGGLRGHSSTSLTIGTGTKIFNTQADLDFQTGETVRALYIGNGTRYMEGTVISYSGITLQLDVTQTGGSGAYGAWTLAVAGLTEIINNAANDWGVSMINVSEDPAHSVEISGIHFIDGTATNGNHLTINKVFGGQPVLIHDSWFSAGAGMGKAIVAASNQGIIFRTSFDTGLWDGPGVDNQAIAFTLEFQPTSWTTADTMGTKDTTGLNNFYVEDNYFAGIPLQALDFDANSRTVVRHNTFNNTGLASHGPDTSFHGLRHFELYDNVFLFNDLGTETYGLNWWLYLRGGTGIIADNVMPDINSQEWGDKGEIVLIVQNIRRDAGPYPGWEPYPSPRQVGQGQDGNGYVLDPLYIWNNTGNPEIGLPDYQPDEIGKDLHTADYIQENRDYYVGVVKPGYEKYAYPHPLQEGPVVAPVVGENIFTTESPQTVGLTDSVNQELGARFQSSDTGEIKGVRFWKDVNETGTHIGQIWSNTGQSLATVTFNNETASGWQEQVFTTPLRIDANTEFTVTVNTGATFYVSTDAGLASSVANGSLSTIVGNNGVFGPVGSRPTNSANDANYFRDVFFVADAPPPIGENIFTTQSPALVDLTDGVSYELGARFQSSVAGEITGIRFWKSVNETSVHVGQIWSNTGLSLATTTFTGETASGWQEQAFAIPLPIDANTEYTVTVNTGSEYYVATNNGLDSVAANGSLSTISGDNGVFGPVGSHPTDSFQNSNYFRDVFFVADVATALGDFDNDGDVDGNDFLSWQTSFGLNNGGDADNDQDTDGGDLLVWQSNFGSGSSGSAASLEPVVQTEQEELDEVFAGLSGVVARVEPRPLLGPVRADRLDWRPFVSSGPSKAMSVYPQVVETPRWYEEVEHARKKNQHAEKDIAFESLSDDLQSRLESPF